MIMNYLCAKYMWTILSLDVLTDHTILYQPRTTIKSQALADFLVD